MLKMYTPQRGRELERGEMGRKLSADVLVKHLKNESALTKPKAPEKRISLKKGIVSNCFNIMEPF
jgi:hypothetical protein